MFRNIAVGAALLIVSAGAAQAQVALQPGLELRGGAAFPTQDLGDAELKTGGAVELMANLRVLPHVHVYGGWGYTAFRMDKGLLGNKYDVEETGYNFGMQFRHPVYNSIGAWLMGGGIVKHIELENDAGDLVADSGHELGWEVGGGMTVPVAAGIAFTPGVRYRTFSADVTLGNTTVPVDLSYVTAEIGVLWTFGGSRTVTARTR